MNINLPTNAMGQIASSTTGAISSFSGPALLIGGVLLAFLVIGALIQVFSANQNMAPNQGHESGV